MEIIADKGEHPTVEVDFEFKHEEVEEEVYHDAVEDPVVDFLQESSSEEEEEEEEDAASVGSHSEEEEEEKVVKSVDFEDMDEEFVIEFAKRILKGIWKYEKEECSENEVFYFKRYFFHPSSTWEHQMMRNEIIMASKIQDPFLIQLSLFLFQIVVDQNIEMMEELRQAILSEVIHLKKINRHFQKRYAKLEEKNIAILGLLLTITRKDIVQMIYDSGFFETKDYYQFYMDVESNSFIEKIDEDSLSSDFHQVPISTCRIVSLRDLI